MLIALIRSVILYVFVIFSIRLMGKRQLGELQPSELVITILLSNIATLPIEDTNIPMIMGLIPIIILVSLDVIISNLTLQSKTLRKFISGSPRIIIQDGKINQQEMRKLRYSIDDLMESLREINIFDIKDVQFAIVETTGKINVYQKFGAQNVTAQMMGLKGTNENPPVVLISDGKLLKKAFNNTKLGEGWVWQLLKEKKLQIKDVFLLSADDNGDYYLVKKENGKA